MDTWMDGHLDGQSLGWTDTLINVYLDRLILWWMDTWMTKCIVRGGVEMDGRPAGKNCN